jgi:hypothetical protein
MQFFVNSNHIRVFLSTRAHHGKIYYCYLDFLLMKFFRQVRTEAVLHLASPVVGTLAPAEGDLVSVPLIALPGLLFSMFHLNHCR